MDSIVKRRESQFPAKRPNDSWHHTVEALNAFRAYFSKAEEERAELQNPKHIRMGNLHALVLQQKILKHNFVD